MNCRKRVDYYKSAETTLFVVWNRNDLLKKMCEKFEKVQFYYNSNQSLSFQTGREEAKSNSSRAQRLVTTGWWEPCRLYLHWKGWLIFVLLHTFKLVFTPGTKNWNWVIDSHTRGYPGTGNSRCHLWNFTFPDNFFFSPINADDPLYCTKHTGELLQ